MKREERLRVLYEDETMREWLRIADAASVFVSVYACGFLLLTAGSFVRACRIAVVLGVPFLLVTLCRALVSAKRPFEVYDFYEPPKHSHPGHSFPSRHAFAAFAIATLLLTVAPSFGAVSLALAALLCVSRVLRGYHFPRDVIAGGLIGVLSSFIGNWILLR